MVETVAPAVAALTIFVSLLVYHWQIKRLDQRASDVELICDTVLKCAQIARQGTYGGQHPRLRTEVVEDKPATDWDEVESLPHIPNVKEIEETIESCGGDTREAACVLMTRRGINPEDDDAVRRWNSEMSTEL